MAVAGILTQAQASDINLATSIQQWLMSNVVTPYNAAASSAGVSQGMSLQSTGAWTPDSNGLGLLPGLPDDQSIYLRVPVVAYSIDYKEPKNPVSTGMGDGAVWEYRSVSLCCLPAITSDTDGTIQPNRQAQWLLKSFIANATTRTNTIPIVDHSQAQVGGLYPQIGYAEILEQKIHSLERFQQMQDAYRYRFDVFFDIRWAVQTTN